MKMLLLSFQILHIFIAHYDDIHFDRSARIACSRCRAFFQLHMKWKNEDLPWGY